MIEYRTDYTIRTWDSLQNLEALLNLMVNKGWRVDSHRLSEGETGWTIFIKTTMLKQPLLDRSINVGEVYRILNRVLEPGSEVSRDFDKQIKSSVKLEGDE